MATQRSRRGGMREHRDALAALERTQPRYAVAFGTCEPLLAAAEACFTHMARSSGATECLSIEATSVSEEQLAALLEQTSVFEPQVAYVVRRCEQAKTLPKLVAALPKDGEARALFVLRGDGPNATLKAALDKRGLAQIPCLEPWPDEVPKIVFDLAKERGLALSTDAVALICDATGSDLNKITHELTRLALLHTAAGKPLDARDIAPELGMLREDEAFALDRLLLERQWAKAHALAVDLLARGERELALVGIVASHCRNALKIIDAMRQGATPAQLSSVVRLPPTVLRLYGQKMRQAKLGPFARTLEKCQEADVLLKTSKVSGELLIASLIESLADAGH